VRNAEKVWWWCLFLIKSNQFGLVRRLTRICRRFPCVSSGFAGHVLVGTDFYVFGGKKVRTGFSPNTRRSFPVIYSHKLHTPRNRPD
jgi:hypothetical protein